MLVCLLVFSGVMLAVDPDSGPSTGYRPPPQGRSEITMTVLNDYALSDVFSPRGLDYDDYYGQLLMTDFASAKLFYLNPEDGSVNGTLLDGPSGIFGVAVLRPEHLWRVYVNAWGDTKIYKASGEWIYAFPNPVPSEPRGMDSDDEGMLWSIDAATRHVYRFNKSGGDVTSWALPELPDGYACGLSTFFYDSNPGIVAGGYTYGDFYFYGFDGSSMNYIGAAAEPHSATASYGIAYSNTRDSFFWLYRTGPYDYRITEFELDIAYSLSPYTWGGIKSSF